MAKTDIFGKKPYKNTPIRSAKPIWDYCCVLALRTDADMLRFSKMIYTETNYLFYISQNRFRVEELDKSATFQAFIHKDILSDNKVFYLQNTGFESDRTLLGYGDNALFPIKRQKRKQKNQISLYFEEEEADSTEEESGEIQDWHDFKADLYRNSVDIMSKIDYLFPIQIETYEIVKPFLQHLPKMHEVNYMLLEPERFENADTFFKYIDLMMEEIKFVDKKL